MQASSPMSPESRPKRGSRKLTSEKQDLPGNGSRAEHVGRARLDAAEAVAPRCGAHGSSGWRAHDEACHSDALGLVGLLGQVRVVGAHGAGGEPAATRQGRARWPETKRGPTSAAAMTARTELLQDLRGG